MATNRAITSNNNGAHALDVPHLARKLHVQLERYIEAQYPIRHPAVVAERHALLETAGVISREPFIEGIPGFTGGPRYHDLALPPLVTASFEELSSLPSAMVPPRLYKHQAEALEAFLGNDRDLVVVTGTGSGKTETFLLPILVRSLEEAKTRPHSFRMPGMRALILYPMNALVNDQLTRLRRLFGDQHFVSWFRQRYSATRPIRFGMYTSRTPYPGMMSQEKNRQQLLPLLEYYLQLEEEQARQADELKKHGRWPALDMVALNEAALAGKTHVGESDYELYTRHQMQLWCPDILITNYSMLEYMLMRPIERSIFQQTAEWLADNTEDTLLIVLDEAHLYSGVTGAEIALLLRRLQARLGIDRDRVRYILTSASLDTGSEGQKAIRDFATTLAGTRTRPGPGFAIIQGQRVSAPPSPLGSTHASDREAIALAQFDLSVFTSRATDLTAGQIAVVKLAEQLGWPSPLSYENLPLYLGQQLPRLPVFRKLWEMTSGNAQAFGQLAQHLFPALNEQARGMATSSLLALAAAAIAQDERPLLPVRAHLFFRGLPPLYACINPHCSARRINDGSPTEIGALWLSRRLHCTCGARVYELYGHRNCGAIFLRAFAASEPADFYWHEPGGSAYDGDGHSTETFLLLGQPHPKASNLEPIFLERMTGRAIPGKSPFAKLVNMDQENKAILVYRPQSASTAKRGKKQREEAKDEDAVREWKSCPVCHKRLRESSITSLSTKGEQPFVNLVRSQFELQPPGMQAQDAAPNMGRKVLLFSDGRQRAARLARDLPREVELDTFRQALLLAVAQRKQRVEQPLVRMDIALYREFVGVCACHRLHFFDGESQAALLRQIHKLREDYELDVQLAEDEEWEPSIPQGYRLALLRQVADRFYSMQRMCAAVVEPIPSSLRLLKKKQIFARLTENDLRALAINWIEALLDDSAFDANISPSDRKDTVAGEGFAITGDTAKAESWNDAEKAAETLLGYARSELQQIRMALVDELCEAKDGLAFLKPEKLAIRLTLEDSWYQCSECAQLIWLPLGGKCPNSHCGGQNLVQLPGDDPSLRARTDFYREPIRQVVAGQRSPVHMTAEEHTAQLSYRDAHQISATTEQYELRFQDIGISAERPAIDILSCTTTMEVGVDIGTLLGIGLRTMPPRRANYQQRAGRAGRRSAALSTVLSYSENGSHDGHYFAHPNEMISGTLPYLQISRVNERLARRHIQAALIQIFFLAYTQEPNKVSDRQYGYLAEALGKARSFFTSSEPYGLSGFERWLKGALEGNIPLLAQQIAAWLPDDLADRTKSGQQKSDFVRHIAHDFVANLRQLGKQMFPDNTGVNIQEQNDQFGTGSDETMLLDALFEHGFLPMYAFPREVCSFVIEEWKQSSGRSQRIGIKQRPQQSIDVALSEYAPGRELIVDKATYRVGGIYVDPFPGATLANRVPSIFKRACSTFALCAKCGYTHHEQGSAGTGSSERLCPLCQTQLAIEEILDPPGFAPERAKRLDPGQIRNDGSAQSGTVTQVKLVLPLTDAEDFASTTADGRVAWSFAEHRELLIANRGVDGKGFSICRSCGAAAPGDPSWLNEAHDRPFLVPGWVAASRKCYGSEGIWHGYLGHTFHSDLLLLRFLWPAGVAFQIAQPWMRDALNTLAQALLLAATRLLDVATSELQVGWSYTIAAQQIASNQARAPRMANFFIFDTLSGGAGYATQVGHHIEALLTQTQNILDHCPEQCERSCYRCLRNYANRILHHHLDRHLAGVLLRALASGKAPETPPIAKQAEQLDALCQFLELAGGIECYRERELQGLRVPLLVKSTHGTYALGAYPVQQDRQVVRHPLDTLPNNRVQLFSDYELAHNLPQVAQLLL